MVGRSRRHHGWANPRKWEEPALGPHERTERGSPRVTASAREMRATSEKEGGRGLRPCEDTRARVWLPARRLLLQKSVGDVWLQISSANALQKERSGSSERGPSSERTLAGETVSGCFGRTAIRVSASPVKTAEDRHKAQGGERSSSSGRTIAQSGDAVSGPGL